MCDACGLATHARARGRSTDPTKTLTLRRNYEGQFASRWGEVRRASRALVVEDNAFGIGEDGDRITALAKYQFATVPDRVAAYQAWFAQQVNRSLFDGNLSKSYDEAADRFFGNSFANTAYRRGIINGAGQIKSAGGRVASSFVEGAVTRDKHLEALKRLNMRAFDDLQGISAAASKQIGNTIATGLVEQWSTAAIAAAISERIDKIGIQRSRLIARTEIISAFNEAELNTYDDAGLAGVMLEPELLTAGDNRVCELCEAAARVKYTVATARGVLPLHPNCRCTWLPVIVNGREIDLK